jgi:hypothetical protein
MAAADRRLSEFKAMGGILDQLDEFNEFEPTCDFAKVTPEYLARKKASQRESRAKMREALTIQDGVFRHSLVPRLLRSK